MNQSVEKLLADICSVGGERAKLDGTTIILRTVNLSNLLMFEPGTFTLIKFWSVESVYNSKLTEFVLQALCLVVFLLLLRKQTATTYLISWPPVFIYGSNWDLQLRTRV